MIVDYEVPSDNSIKDIENFFDNLEFYPQRHQFLNLKKRDTFRLSNIDMMSLAFSKERDCILVFNEYDVTFFCRGIIRKRLVQ